MHGKRLVTIIALALAGVAFLAVGAQATAYTWTAPIRTHGTIQLLQQLIIGVLQQEPFRMPIPIRPQYLVPLV